MGRSIFPHGKARTSLFITRMLLVSLHPTSSDYISIMTRIPTCIYAIPHPFVRVLVKLGGLFAVHLSSHCTLHTNVASGTD